jgi:pimeloyl-ACP methyl ester carboxylesterase/DNA-binding SARP family transcriptional activator
MHAVADRDPSSAAAALEKMGLARVALRRPDPPGARVERFDRGRSALVTSSEPPSIRLLGPIEVWRGEHPIALPPSRKTRALLAYLAASSRWQRRNRLAGLLWDVTDDPRAALRWSLSKLRALLDDADAPRIVTEGDNVRLDPRGADIDVHLVRRATEGRLTQLPLDRLQSLLARFRGPFLEGLELSDFGEFQAWCVAEREHWRSKHLRLLRAAVDRLEGDPEQGLVHARELVRLSPDDEGTRATLIRLLFTSGRRDEAEEHYRLGLRELERKGSRDTGELRSTWRSLEAPAVASAVTAAPSIAQQVRFCTAPDGARIGWASVGHGPAILKAANWLSHLEYDWKSPLWRHLARDLSDRHQLVRYDQRGNGLSDWEVEDVSFDAFVSDLEAVADAAGLRRFALLGISQGSRTAIAYAVRHPERVSHLILYGGTAAGWRHRAPDQVERRSALATLMRTGWGGENPAFRALFSNLFMPGATPEQIEWFNELQQVACSGEMAVRITEATGASDVTPMLAQVRTPTLVLHATRDAMVHFEDGRRMAAAIPGARFVALDSPNHLLLGDEPAWARFVAEVRAFLAENGEPQDLPRAR